MKTFTAHVEWAKQGPPSPSGHFPSGHHWVFDGGGTVHAAASPLSMPEPYAVSSYVDPEEALVAAASSCHMMFFLYFAHKMGLSVLSYEDDPEGVMDRTDEGCVAFTKIMLRPEVEYEGYRPTPEQVEELHAKAHSNCFIANSIKADVEILSG